MYTYIVGYSCKYIDEDGEEMLTVSSDFEASIDDQADLDEIFRVVLDEIEGKVQTLTFTLKEKS